MVRKRRPELSLSQEQLAQMSGVSTRTLQRIERGASASPETLKGITAALDMDFSDLRREIMPQDDAAAAPLAAAPPAALVGDAEREAMEYVRDIKAFYHHLAIFVVVLTGLALVNLFVTAGYPWVLWVAFGWGVGLVSHALGVFEIVSILGPDWERRQIRKRLEKR